MYVPEPLTIEQLKACMPLLNTCPFKPYSHYRQRMGEECLNRHFAAQVNKHIQDERHSFFWIPGQPGAIGMAGWSRLDWDTQQLGVAAGRLNYLIASGDGVAHYAAKESLLQAALKSCSARGIRHLSCRVHSSDLAGIHVLEQHGFIVVDGILTFSIDLNGSGQARDRSAKPMNFEVRLCRPDDIDQVKTIGRSSYIYDRFHSDPKIPKPVSDELHAVWVENSCTGKAADAVVVAAEGRQILGFVTCTIDASAKEYLGLNIGTIVLVATVAGGRHRGVARAMTYGALDWFRQQGADIVEVGTQFRNIPASRLYESCGFPLVASSLSLRKWI